MLYLQIQMLQLLSVPVQNMLHILQTDVQQLAEICTSSRMGRNACPVSSHCFGCSLCCSVCDKGKHACIFGSQLSKKLH